MAGQKRGLAAADQTRVTQALGRGATPSVTSKTSTGMGRKPPGRASWRCSERRARCRGPELCRPPRGRAFFCCASSWPSLQRRATRTGTPIVASVITATSWATKNPAAGCGGAGVVESRQAQMRKSSADRLATLTPNRVTVLPGLTVMTAPDAPVVVAARMLAKDVNPDPENWILSSVPAPAPKP